MHTQALSRRLWIGLLFLPCALMLAGCGKGSSQGSIAGKVSYKGKPLKGGNVALISQEGGTFSSEIEQDGSFKLSKVPAGPAKITVETHSLRPMNQKALPGPYSHAPKDVLPPNVQGDANRYVPIPQQYANPESSGLSMDVQKGKNDHDIDLK